MHRVLQRGQRQRDVPDSATAVEDVGDLRALCLAIDLRSLTKVAQLTRESKATVSRRITRLERALDVALLHRTPKRVEPTEAGEAYRLRARQILELLSEANASAAGAHAMPTGTLRITAPGELASYLAPRLIAFREAYPDVHLDVVMTQRVLDLDAEHLDVAFRVSHHLKDSSLVAHRLGDLTIAFVAAPRYLAGHAAPKRMEDLPRHRLLRVEFAGGTHGVRLRARDGSVEALPTSQRSFVATSELRARERRSRPVNAVRRAVG